MSAPFIDGTIFILLIAGIGFAAIGVIGLMLFPDIRSRMYTAFRATMISISAIILSVIIYGLFTFSSSGGDQYIALILHSMVFLFIVALANVVVYKTIFNRIKPVPSCQTIPDQNRDDN
jgi:multicomponent Na+:H+ antiporter subunit G